jgi:cytochrome oxidase Cu insertion factor (SCO1/SenC/PrrC family)
MSGRTILKYSTIAAALLFVGHVATASAAESRTHRNVEMDTAAARGAPVTRIDQNGDYVIDRTPGAVPNTSH